MLWQENEERERENNSNKLWMSVETKMICWVAKLSYTVHQLWGKLPGPGVIISQLVFSFTAIQI